MRSNTASIVDFALANHEEEEEEEPAEGAEGTETAEAAESTEDAPENTTEGNGEET